MKTETKNKLGITPGMIVGVKLKTDFENKLYVEMPEENGTTSIVYLDEIPNEEGKTPRQLAEENAELLEVLKSVLKEQKMRPVLARPRLSIEIEREIESAIRRAEGNE